MQKWVYLVLVNEGLPSCKKLKMKKTKHFLFHLVFFALVLNAAPFYGQETTTYYLIRHAEKDLSDKSNRNPHLTEVGHARAEAWRSVFKHLNFDLIYSSPYHRTEETAQPTADAQQLSIETYDPRDLYNEAFQRATQGKRVLVVGHSNTTPKLANTILGEAIYRPIDESIHGNLYIISIVNGEATSQLLFLE